MNIKNQEDRIKFEQEQLYPSLKKIYSGIFGKREPIIVGSCSLYMQGVYPEQFPNDIDITFNDDKNIEMFNMVYRNMCKQHGMKCEFVDCLRPFNDEYTYINIEGVNIKTTTVSSYINAQRAMCEYWTQKNNQDKVCKYTRHLDYLNTVMKNQN